MARYTNKSLENDLNELNQKLTKLYALNSDFYPDKDALLYFVVGSRYGYSAVDLATKNDIERNCTHRVLITGTPKECYTAALEWMVFNHI